MRGQPYIGVTGVVTAEDVAALRRCVALLPTGYRLMAGVLVSAKTLCDEPTTNARYPRFDDVPGLLTALADAGCWPVVHFNCRAGLREHLQALAGLDAVRGLQLNVGNPDLATVSAFKEWRPDVELILQVNAAAQDESGTLTKASALRYMDRYDSVADFALVDASGGRGKAMDLSLATSLAPMRRGMAFAGGFGPGSFESVHALCQAGARPSFDAETRVRRPLASGAVEGLPYQDELDPEAAMRWVREAARAVMRGRS